MNNIAGYLRVSSKEQETENQLPAVIAWAEAHGYNKERVVLYQENESAWKSGHQHELSRLLSELRSGRRKYDFLVVYALDRLTRGKVGDVFNLINAFELQGCRVMSIKESWLPDAGPMRDMFTLMVAWSNNYESVRKSQNTKAGLTRTLAAGVTRNGKRITQLGRPAGSRDKQKRRKKRPVVFKYGGSSVEALKE